MFSPNSWGSIGTTWLPTLRLLNAMGKSTVAVTIIDGLPTLPGGPLVDIGLIEWWQQIALTIPFKGTMTEGSCSRLVWLDSIWKRCVRNDMFALLDIPALLHMAPRPIIKENTLHDVAREYGRQRKQW